MGVVGTQLRWLSRLLSRLLSIKKSLPTKALATAPLVMYDWQDSMPPNQSIDSSREMLAKLLTKKRASHWKQRDAAWTEGKQVLKVATEVEESFYKKLFPPGLNASTAIAARDHDQLWPRRWVVPFGGVFHRRGVRVLSIANPLRKCMRPVVMHFGLGVPVYDAASPGAMGRRDSRVLESIQNPKGFHGVSPWLLTFVSGMQRSRGASSNVVKAKQIAKKLSNAKKLFEKGPFAIQSIIAALLYGVPQVDRKRIRSRYLTKLKALRDELAHNALYRFDGSSLVLGHDLKYPSHDYDVMVYVVDFEYLEELQTSALQAGVPSLLGAPSSWGGSQQVQVADPAFLEVVDLLIWGMEGCPARPIANVVNLKSLASSWKKKTLLPKPALKKADEKEAAGETARSSLDRVAFTDPPSDAPALQPLLPASATETGASELLRAVSSLTTTVDTPAAPAAQPVSGGLTKAFLWRPTAASSTSAKQSPRAMSAVDGMIDSFNVSFNKLFDPALVDQAAAATDSSQRGGAEAERASAAEGADPPPAAATGATRALFTTAAAAFSSGDLLRRDKVAASPGEQATVHVSTTHRSTTSTTTTAKYDAIVPPAAMTTAGSLPGTLLLKALSESGSKAGSAPPTARTTVVPRGERGAGEADGDDARTDATSSVVSSDSDASRQRDLCLSPRDEPHIAASTPTVARAGGAARGGFMAAAASVTQAHERNVTIVPELPPPTGSFAENQATPFAENQATPFAENQATPFAENQATPFAENQATPFVVRRRLPTAPTRAGSVAFSKTETDWNSTFDEQLYHDGVLAAVCSILQAPLAVCAGTEESSRRERLVENSESYDSQHTFASRDSPAQPFGDQWVKSFVNTRSYLDAHPPPPDKPKSIAPLAGREANPKPFAPPRLFAEKVDNPLTFAPPVRAGAV